MRVFGLDVGSRTLSPALSHRQRGLGVWLVLGLALLYLLFSRLYPPSLPDLPTPRRALAATVLDNQVYVTGGWSGQATQLDLVHVFSLSTRRWTQGAPLTVARSQHGLVAADGRLWAIGGWSADGGLVEAVEVWSPSQSEWRVVTHLPTPRREPGVAVLGRQIVVAGGFDGHSDGDLDGYSDHVEAYNLDTRQWTRLARLNTPRRGLALVAAHGVLYALGGYAMPGGFLAAAERYDAAADTWRIVDWPLVARTWTAVVALDRDLLLMGGYNGQGPLGLVERIDPHTGLVCQPPPLHVPRAWLTAVTTETGILALGGETATGMSGAVEWVTSQCR